MHLSLHWLFVLIISLSMIPTERQVQQCTSDGMPCPELFLQLFFLSQGVHFFLWRVLLPQWLSLFLPPGLTVTRSCPSRRASLLLLHFAVGELLRHGARRYEGDQIGSGQGEAHRFAKKKMIFSQVKLFNLVVCDAFKRLFLPNNRA